MTVSENAYQKLIQKYNVPCPRYTSYPTVPFWEESQTNAKQWFEAVQKTFNKTNENQGIAVYIHLPFCEQLCTYCGCNKRITKRHSVEEPYLHALLTEWQNYLDVFNEKPIIRELHLGGGTPTFFSPKSLEFLISEILKTADLHPDYEFSFEGHPNNTTEAHLQTLFGLGFRRVSYGVQDFDEKVQRTINRLQPYENVAFVTETARKIGYESVNFDLVYGLPFQTLETITDTITKTLAFRPERIAFYSYAHVPWKSPGQRAYTEIDLPNDAEKRALYELGCQMLTEAGYVDIGMDHFSLSQDTLYKAHENKILHRNFMGYTTSSSELLIGLGASSISDAGTAYVQNEKHVERYQEEILQGEMPFRNGHFLTENDLLIKAHILDIICKGETEFTPELLRTFDKSVAQQLAQMQYEKLLQFSDKGLKVSNLGFTFIRNICAVFDERMRQKHTAKARSATPQFSQSV